MFSLVFITGITCSKTTQRELKMGIKSAMKNQDLVLTGASRFSRSGCSSSILSSQRPSAGVEGGPLQLGPRRCSLHIYHRECQAVANCGTEYITNVQCSSFYLNIEIFLSNN